ncbi:MAG TPA: lasso peptide biosynthesis B2 protein [bacterium]|nr:lasso peptide biosynthesis B2 protein [bacterium]
MNRPGRFLRFPPAEQRLLVKVSILLVAIRWSLRFLSFQRLRQLLERFTKPSTGRDNPNPFYQKKVVWAVNRTSHHLLGANACFPRALATHILLKRRGFPVRMYIGVRKDNDGLLHAHAWVKSNGVVIIGGTESTFKRYTILPDIGEVWP